MTGTQREAFEAWYVDNCPDIITEPIGCRTFTLQFGAWQAALTQPQAQQEPVGEIVLFGGDLKEVSWRNGRMPAAGVKLYAQAQQAAAVPAGWKLVPIKPTEKMLDEGGNAGDGHDWAGPESVWDAMLSSAPAAPQALSDEQCDAAINRAALNYIADADSTNRDMLRKLCREAVGTTGGEGG